MTEADFADVRTDEASPEESTESRTNSGGVRLPPTVESSKMAALLLEY
jgi:hypothetical protein